MRAINNSNAIQHWAQNPRQELEPYNQEPGGMSRVQRFFKAVLPRHWMQAMRLE